MTELKVMLGLLDRAKGKKEEKLRLVNAYIAAHNLLNVPAGAWEEVRKQGIRPESLVREHLAALERPDRFLLFSVIMDEAQGLPCRYGETTRAFHWWRKGTEKGIITRDIQRIFCPEMGL